MLYSKDILQMIIVEILKIGNDGDIVCSLIAHIGCISNPVVHGRYFINIKIHCEAHWR